MDMGNQLMIGAAMAGAYCLGYLQAGEPEPVPVKGDTTVTVSEPVKGDTTVTVSEPAQPEESHIKVTSKSQESHIKVTRKSQAEMTSEQLTEIYNAIRQVETGGHPDPANAAGDGGASLGPMQIGRLYFIDALEHDEALRDSEVVYDDVRNESIAREVMYAYWSRYARIPWTAEDLCRLHNGGPSRRGTDAYWAKCRAILEGE